MPSSQGKNSFLDRLTDGHKYVHQWEVYAISHSTCNTMDRRAKVHGNVNYSKGSTDKGKQELNWSINHKLAIKSVGVHNTLSHVCHGLIKSIHTHVHIYTGCYTALKSSCLQFASVYRVLMFHFVVHACMWMLAHPKHVNLSYADVESHEPYLPNNMLFCPGPCHFVPDIQKELGYFVRNPWNEWKHFIPDS